MRVDKPLGFFYKLFINRNESASIIVGCHIIRGCLRYALYKAFVDICQRIYELYDYFDDKLSHSTCESHSVTVIYRIYSIDCIDLKQKRPILFGLLEHLFFLN